MIKQLLYPAMFFFFPIFLFQLPMRSPLPAEAKVHELAGKDSMILPHLWLGEWKGELNIYQGNQMVQAIPMQMTIKLQEDGCWAWSTHYQRKGANAIEKPYVLCTTNAAQGHLRLDEQNGIFIESYFQAGQLTSWYEVMGNLIMARYQVLENGQMLFEIVAGSQTPISVTGDTIIGTDTIPPVSTFPVRVYQKALLHKQK